MVNGLTVWQVAFVFRCFIFGLRQGQSQAYVERAPLSTPRDCWPCQWRTKWPNHPLFHVMWRNEAYLGGMTCSIEFAWNLSDQAWERRGRMKSRKNKPTRCTLHLRNAANHPSRALPDLSSIEKFRSHQATRKIRYPPGKDHDCSIRFHGLDSFPILRPAARNNARLLICIWFAECMITKLWIRANSRSLVST